jgi:hypothetical protein
MVLGQFLFIVFAVCAETVIAIGTVRDIFEAQKIDLFLLGDFRKCKGFHINNVVFGYRESSEKAQSI